METNRNEAKGTPVKDVPPKIREYSPKDLEAQNFRIDSTGWTEKTDPNGVRYIENPEGDVWELVGGPGIPSELVGEQHFANNGALERELAQAGKRTMTPGEWDSFARRHADWMIESLLLSGSRSNSSAYRNQGAYGYFWTSLAAGTYGIYVALSSAEVFTASYSDRMNGLSVRCLKD